MPTSTIDRVDEISLRWRRGEDAAESPAGELFPHGRYAASEITATGYSYVVECITWLTLCGTCGPRECPILVEHDN
jgi:hypothetical protein